MRTPIAGDDPRPLIDKVIAEVAAMVDRSTIADRRMSRCRWRSCARGFPTTPTSNGSMEAGGRAMMTVEEAAKQAQRRALDPEESVWVAASAGTGKTKVLTDRLLALMLDGTDPGAHLVPDLHSGRRRRDGQPHQRAAGRLDDDAARPAGAGPASSSPAGFPPEAEIARARQLFARVLDLPGGTKIATIHAFCQSLLRRFPLEAGVPPEFVVTDERSAREALVEAAETVILAARAEHDAPGGLAEALGIVAGYAPEERFFELMGDIAAERGKLRAALVDGEVALRRRLCGQPRGSGAARRRRSLSRRSAPAAPVTKRGCAHGRRSPGRRLALPTGSAARSWLAGARARCGGATSSTSISAPS